MVLILIAAWVAVIVLVLAVCRAAATGDAMQVEAVTDRAERFTFGPASVRRSRASVGWR